MKNFIIIFPHAQMFFAFYKMEYVVQKLISDDDMKRLEGQFFKIGN